MEPRTGAGRDMLRIGGYITASGLTTAILAIEAEAAAAERAAIRPDIEHLIEDSALLGELDAVDALNEVLAILDVEP